MNDRVTGEPKRKVIEGQIAVPLGEAVNKGPGHRQTALLISCRREREFKPPPPVLFKSLAQTT